jgi:hypothetical protein
MIMSFKLVLCTILDDNLIPDIINIIYKYAIRYGDPQVEKNNTLHHFCDDFSKYKYISRPNYWFDHKMNTVCINRYHSICCINRSQSNHVNDSKLTINQSIDVLDDKICIGHLASSTLRIFDKRTLQMLYSIKTQTDVDQCIFVTDKIIMTLHNNYVLLYKEHNVVEKHYNETILSIVANHDNIVMLEQHETSQITKNIYLTMYDHDLNFIKSITVGRFCVSKYNMRVYDNIIYISNKVITVKFVMPIL